MLNLKVFSFGGAPKAFDGVCPGEVKGNHSGSQGKTLYMYSPYGYLQIDRIAVWEES